MSVKYFLLFCIACALRYPASTQVPPPAFRYTSPDSVETHASDQYKASSFLRTVLMGKNYRKAWEQAVTLPVFRLSQTRFKVTDLGGGKQTKSLHLLDEKGKEWGLRSLEKDVTPSLSSFFQHTVMQDFMQDQVSSSMPYGSLIVGSLAQSMKITAAKPSYFFVADDPALGPYKQFFANRVCMLEERGPGFDSTVNTETVLRQIQRTNNFLIDQKALLKARLLDMLVADFDRHHDNWRWGVADSGNTHYYKAIPRDRDWAFYQSKGLVPRMATFAALHFLVNFNEKPARFGKLNRKAYFFDGAFLNTLNAGDWHTSIHQLQQDLTNDAIETAVKALPPAVFSIYGASFIKTLKSRRDGLESEAMKYYLFLAKQVQVDGTNDPEIFLVTPAENGLLLQVHRQGPGGTKGQKIYERKFSRSETYRLIINGLGGGDRFEVTEGTSTRIKLTLNGGTGNDTYNLHGDLRTQVHDYTAEKNSVDKNGKAKVHLH